MRLIDADEFKEYIEDGIKIAFIQAPWEAKKVEIMADAIIKDIDEQPTIEAVPVIHAKWIFEEADTDGIGNNQYKCSHCGHGDIHADDVVVNYCWFCGARMDGDKENERL